MFNPLCRDSFYGLQRAGKPCSEIENFSSWKKIRLQLEKYFFLTGKNNLANWSVSGHPQPAGMMITLPCCPRRMNPAVLTLNSTISRKINKIVSLLLEKTLYLCTRIINNGNNNEKNNLTDYHDYAMFDNGRTVGFCESG